eukprot:jgi/Psemu1/49615/gm1.49615_g
MSNYSKTKLIKLLHTIKAILPISPEDWDVIAQIHRDNFPDTNRSVQNLHRKYTNLYCKQVPTGNPNCPEEVELARRIKWLVKDKAEVGDGEEEFDLEEVTTTSSEDGDDVDIDISDDNYNNSDDSPPLRQPSQPSQPTQPPPTQPPLRQPSQPTQPNRHQPNPASTSTFPTNSTTQPELNAPINGDINFASSPSPQSAKRQYRNTKVNDQETLTFLRENSKLKREQRRENSWLKKEHREAVLEAERLHPPHVARVAGVYQRDGFDLDGWTLTWIK